MEGCWNNSNFPVDLPVSISLKHFNTEEHERISVLRASALDFYFITVSEKSRTSVFEGYSITTLYISVVLVIGNFIRGFLSGASFKILYDDMPKPGALFRLCTGVAIARYDNNLRREGELYLELIEVLRSTEVMKLLTKTAKEVYTFKKDKDDAKTGEKVEEKVEIEEKVEAAEEKNEKKKMD